MHGATIKTVQKFEVRTATLLRSRIF